MLKPVLPAPGDSTRAAEVDLLSWCETGPDVLRLGHIDDPPRRHYSAFFRPQAMRQQKDAIRSQRLSFRTCDTPSRTSGPR